MKDEMKRGRSQVIWRYTPGAMFRYNESGGWCRTTHVTLRDPAPLTGVFAEAVNEALFRWSAIGLTGYPDPTLYPNKYEIGEPYQVMYTVWPTVFTCRSCGQVHFYKDLAKLRQVNDWLGCMSCKGRDRLRQVPYAYVCECGRIDSISMQKHEVGHPIELVNKGNFQESFWWCKTCHKPLYRHARDGLGYRPCSCKKKSMRGILLEDSRVYYSQTIDLVEIEPAVLNKWKDNARFSDVLLGAVLQIPSYEPGHLLDLAKWKPSEEELSTELKVTRALLIQNGMSEASADAIVRQSAKQAGSDPWVSYDRDLSPYRHTTDRYVWKDNRRTREYVFVRDEPSSVTVSLEDLITEANSLGDVASAQRWKTERELASQLGLVDLRVVQALPILLAGIGYTRYFGGPRDLADTDGSGNEQPVVLRPYDSSNEKIPMYVARNTTEALLYNLDPWRLAAFLHVNMNLTIPDEMAISTPALRVWLLSKSDRLMRFGESHLVLKSFEKEAGVQIDEASALLFGVLHSVSHVLKATAHRYVGIDDDSLAEYLFPAHAAGLLYASSHVSFTLGGVDAVFRANLMQWLGSARDYAGRCSFDPVCAQSGGACLACLYPKFGCAYFNRTVSRAFLFGGSVPGYSQPLEGFWAPAITEATKILQKRRTAL